MYIYVYIALQTYVSHRFMYVCSAVFTKYTSLTVFSQFYEMI